MQPAWVHWHANSRLQLACKSSLRHCCLFNTPLLPETPSLHISWRLQVKATPIPGKRADHQGIRVQLIGQIELAAERGHPHDFVSLGEQYLGIRVSVSSWPLLWQCRLQAVRANTCAQPLEACH